MSYLQHLSVVSFKKHNPNWEVVLHMPKTRTDILPTWVTVEQTHRYTGKDYLEKTKDLCTLHYIDFEKHGTHKLHEVQKSDFIRWKILYEQGGVWSDMDILYIKPIDELLKQEFCSTICYDGMHHLIGFYVTEPGQEIYNDIFKEAKERIKAPFSTDYQFIGSRMVKSLLVGDARVYGYPGVLNLSMSVVYPYSPEDSDIQELFFGAEDKIQGDTIGIHWYNGNPIAKKYQNGDYQDNGSVMSREVACFR